MADLSSERIEFESRLEDYLSGFDSGGTTTILASRLALINYVKSKIDEIIPEGEGVQFNVESEPNISDPYNLFINAILDEAAKKTLMSAPIHVIEPTDATTSVKQVDTITLTGESGTANVTEAGGLTKLVTFDDTDLSTTAANFVTDHAAAYLSEGIVVTSDGADIIFTAEVAGTGFTNPEITNATGDLSGTVVNTQANAEAKEAVQIGTDDIGYIELPANFLRLISLKMTDWEREVNEAITTYHPLYKLQKNKYVRGGIAKPVAVYTWKVISNESKRVIEYYSIDENHTIEKFLYVPETVAEEVQSNLGDAMTWFCAAMVLQIIGMFDAAKIAEEQAVLTYNNM